MADLIFKENGPFIFVRHLIEWPELNKRIKQINEI